MNKLNQLGCTALLVYFASLFFLSHSSITLRIAPKTIPMVSEKSSEDAGQLLETKTVMPAAADQPREIPPPLENSIAQWIQGRDNIFFHEDHFIGDLLQRNHDIITNVGQRLQDLSAVLSLPERPEFITETPKVLKERMALLDISSGILKSRDSEEENKVGIIDQLQAFIYMPILKTFSAQAKSILITEKREALEILASFDREQAQRIWEEIPQQRVRELLKQL